METLRNLWVNWGWSYPYLSSFGVAVVAVILWWAFGALMWLATPKAAPAPNQMKAGEIENTTSGLPKDLKLQSLKRRTQTLATQIFAFLKEWDKNEPRSSGDLGELWGKKNFDQDAFNRAFAEAGDRSRKYSDDMSLKFAKQFGGRVGKIRDELSSEGFESAELDKRIADRPRLKWDIQAISEELQKLASQIDD